MTRLPFSVVVLLFLLSSTTVAEIKSITISSDSRPMIFFGKFRFTQSGLVTISVSSVSVSSPIQNSSTLGFLLLKKESFPNVLFELQQNPNFCILKSHYTLHLFNFNDLSNFQFTNSYPITHPGEYSLFFANCVPETEVSMKVKTEMYNRDPNGSKDYLPTGLTELPGLYLFFSLCYMSFLILWVYFCYKNTQNVQKIHPLMTALLSTKTLNLICATEVEYNVKFTGTAHSWNIPLNVFRFIENVLLFAVIVLIGTGWSFPKQENKKKKKLLLMIVVPVQVLANIASIVIGETGPFLKDWVTWNQIYLLADIVSCCAIIFAMVRWLFSSMRRVESIKNLANLPLFRRFYSLVIVYLVFTRIGVFVLKMIVDYEYEWVSYGAEDFASLAFYVFMFYMFRPMKRNEYFGIQEEAEELVLNKEELEL